MDYDILENFTQWMSNETSPIFAPGSTDISENDEFGNGTTGDYDYIYSDEQLLEFFRSEHVQLFYGPHYYTIFIVSFVVCMIGYITNILNVVVLANSPMSNSIHIFLVSLAISDIIQITTQVSHIVHYFAGYKMFPHYNWVVFFIANTFFENSFVYISNWIAAVIGMWRCVVITWPLQSRELCSPFRAKIIIASIIFLSFLFSTPILYLYTYHRSKMGNLELYDSDLSKIGVYQDGVVMKLFLGLQQLKGLVPMSIMVATTVWLIVILNRIRRQRVKIQQKDTSSSANHKITLMLTILLVLYWLSNVPDSFMFLIHIASPDDEGLQDDYKKRTDIIRIFMLTNSSVSFFIYYVLGEDFRKTFHDIFLRRIAHRKNKSISEGLSETSTVRSKNFVLGPPRKASADSTFNSHFREPDQIIVLKEITQ